jgi:catechol 2,3-dioxygenase-like lactoylglutathione lyase family enzyme
MKPRITLLTLGVDDLERALHFYRDGLGLKVDREMAQAREAGAAIIKPARYTAWGGYAGYFQEPDRHVWEVAWNPHWVAPD